MAYAGGAVDLRTTSVEAQLDVMRVDLLAAMRNATARISRSGCGTVVSGGEP